MRLIRSRHAIVSLWQAHQSDGDWSGIDPSRAESALVVRPELTVQLIPLNESAADFLGELMSGHSLAEAYECSPLDDPPDIAAIFSLLLQTHALTTLSLIDE